MKFFLNLDLNLNFFFFGKKIFFFKEGSATQLRLGNALC